MNIWFILFFQEIGPYKESSESASPSSFSTSSIDSDKFVARSSGKYNEVNKNKVTIIAGRNQLGRIYSPGLPLSMSERETIVKLFQVIIK